MIQFYEMQIRNKNQKSPQEFNANYGHLISGLLIALQFFNLDN
jgi:hypothetical protein|tara:strand:- start:687 stop:815 length:129 start_codon:yes stop_codon:yes gene_type:complete